MAGASPVPGDPDQVIYVWFDALANYITAPGYGTDDTAERLIAAANEDLANNLGNLVDRTVSMVQRYRGGAIPATPSDPWDLAKAERNDGAGTQALDGVLAQLVMTCRDLARHLEPFLPAFARLIAEQCGSGGGNVAEPSPVFPRLELVPT